MNCECFTEFQKVFLVIGATGGLFSAIILIAAFIHGFIDEYSSSDYNKEHG